MKEYTLDGLTLIGMKQAAQWLGIHVDSLRRDIKTGRVNQDAYKLISERRIRFIKEKMISLFLDEKLYADGNT